VRRARFTLLIIAFAVAAGTIRLASGGETVVELDELGTAPGEERGVVPKPSGDAAGRPIPAAGSSQEDPESLPTAPDGGGPDILFTGHCPRSTAALFASARALVVRAAGSAALSPEARLRMQQALAGPAATALAPLQEARAGAPGNRDLTLSLALLQMAAFELHEADSLLSDVLRANPGDASAARLRDHLRARIDRLGPPREAERNGIALRWFGEALQADQASRLVERMDGIREEASRAAGAPVRRHLDVFVYPDLDALHAATCSAKWMGGAFDGARIHLVRTEEATGVNLRIARHEIMHAEIHELVPEVPAWLNEGMAEWFSTPDPRASLLRWRELIVKNRTCIPFSSMLATLQDFEASDADLAYAQSVAMVEYLVAAGGPEAPRRALRFLAQGGDRSRALTEALGRSQVTEDEFMDFLAAQPAQERR
jgi:hypothetical protein